MMLFPSALVLLMARNEDIVLQDNSLALAKSPFTLCEAKYVYGDSGIEFTRMSTKNFPANILQNPTERCFSTDDLLVLL